MQDIGFQTTHPLVITSPGDQSLLTWIKHASTLGRMWLVILQSLPWPAAPPLLCTLAGYSVLHPFSLPSSCWVQGAGRRGGLCYCPGLEGQTHGNRDWMVGRDSHTPRGDCGPHAGPSGQFFCLYLPTSQLPPPTSHPILDAPLFLASPSWRGSVCLPLALPS